MANERKKLSESADLRIDDVEDTPEATEEITSAVLEDSEDATKDDAPASSNGEDEAQAAVDSTAQELGSEDGNDRQTALKFEFAGEIGGGLIFTGEADISPSEDSMKKQSSAENNASDTAMSDTGESSASGNAQSNDSYPSQSFIEDPRNVRATYVPRFTSFSENYRMKNDPRPLPKEETKAPAVSVTQNAETGTDRMNAEKVDPTAEFNSSDDLERVVVTTVSPKDDDGDSESFTLYKFESIVRDSKKEEDKIPLASVADPEPPKEEPSLVEEQEPDVQEEPQTVKAEYFMPDPESKFQVIEYSKKPDYTMEDPEGAHDFTDSKGGFSSPIQRDFVKDKFLDSLMAVKVRLFAAFALLLGLVQLEILAIFGIGVNDLFGLGVNFAAGAVVDFIFAGCMFLIAIPEVLRAVKYLVNKVAVPELFSVASLLVLSIYTLVIAALGVPEYPRFGLLLGIQIVCAILGTYFRLKAEFTSFKIVSKNIVKRVIDKKFTRDLPRENMAVDGIIDEYNSKCARMFRTAFVSDFDKHTAEVAENSHNVLLTMAIGGGVSLVGAFVAFFIGGFSVANAVQAFAMIFLTACPAFSILSHKLPYKDSCTEAEGDNCAFVGEKSFYECSDIDVLTYEDTEIFGAEDISVRKVHLYGKAYNAPKAMKQMYSLFTNIGGPLDRLFSDSLDRKCPAATDVVLEEDGISGLHEGHKICAGSEDYMRRHGVTIPSDDYRSKNGTNDSTKIMYGAEDGAVYVKFFIRYSFSEEFTMSLPYFKEEKIVPLIYTRDPNINLDLIRVLTSGEDLIRILKKDVPKVGEVKTYRRISSGLVTLGEKADAFNMVFLAKRYTKLQQELELFEKLSMAVGAGLSVLMSLIPAFAVPALGLAFWQLAWCGILIFKSKSTFKAVKTDKGN